jgi:hypothetical protein
LNKDYRDWNDNKVQENLDRIEGDISSSLGILSKLTKVDIGGEIQDEMETFVIKTIMKIDLKNEQSYRKLKRSFDKLSLKHRISIWLIEPKRWLRKIFRLKD